MDDVGRGPVAIDTAPFIYFVEDHARYAPIVAPLFEAIDAGRLRAFTSALTLLEVLVVPYRAGNLVLADRYEQLLTRSRGLQIVEIDRVQLKNAAQLRALHRSLRVPDAIQIVAAVTHECGALVTNDRELASVPALRLVSLDDYAG